MKSTETAMCVGCNPLPIFLFNRGINERVQIKAQVTHPPAISSSVELIKLNSEGCH
jgi:hypothetical protein